MDEPRDYQTKKSKSERERQILHVITWYDMRNLKFDINQHIYKTKRDSRIQRTDLRLPRGRRDREGTQCEFGISRGTLFYIGLLNNKVLLCSTGNCIQYLVTNHKGVKMETVTDFIFLGSKITGDSVCSHEVKRQLLLGRKAVTNLVQFSSVAQSRPTLCDPMNHRTPASLSITNSWSSPKPMSIESVMPSNHLILCHSLLLLPSIFPSIRGFSNESALHIRWPKYWSFSFSISPSNQHPGLISFRMDWLDLLAVQGTLKSLIQHHSSKASIPRHSAFFIVQLSHPYMTTGKTIALIRRTFVGKVVSLLFNILSRLVITFLLRSKHLLISW